MPTFLALLLVRVLRNKNDLCIFVFQKGAQIDKVEVLRNKQDGIALVVVVQAIPKLLGKEIKPGSV